LDSKTLGNQIRCKIIEIGRNQAAGQDIPDFTDTDCIPFLGIIDSLGIIELVAWFETVIGRKIDESEATIDNLGTIEAMVAFAGAT
jgi:D-alanine--poly(phosphoribitol) ligase subunit 2